MNKPVCEAYDNAMEMGARGSDFASEEALVPSVGYMAIPALNDGIPDTVTKKELSAADAYEKADKEWKKSCKRRDLGVKEDAGDTLYRLARGLLRFGKFYSYRDYVLDAWDGDAPEMTPDDFEP